MAWKCDVVKLRSLPRNPSRREEQTSFLFFLQSTVICWLLVDPVFYLFPPPCASLFSLDKLLNSYCYEKNVALTNKHCIDHQWQWQKRHDCMRQKKSLLRFLENFFVQMHEVGVILLTCIFLNLKVIFLGKNKHLTIH